jgi:hypothetical protein
MNPITSAMACEARGASHEKLALTVAELTHALNTARDMLRGEGLEPNALEVIESALMNNRSILPDVDPDYAAAEHRAELFRADDPADMEDELRERSERIDLVLDAAYERGADAYTKDGDRDAEAERYYGHEGAPMHPKIRAAFYDGWADAMRDDATLTIDDASRNNSYVES